MPNPREQLELLVAHQKEFESFLSTLTGLTVNVSLHVHSSRNLASDLTHLFEASLSMDNFETQRTSNMTWIAHTDLKKSISVFMPNDFEAEKYTEPEDDEGYDQAVEYANAKRAEGQLKRNNDEIPF